MRIAIDAMGGDYAPDEIIAGALEVLPQLEKDDVVLLVGPQGMLETKLAGMTYDKNRLSIVDAPDVIAMDEKPIDSLRKKPRSSIGVLAKLAKLDRADAVISAGNTGACVAAFQMRMRTLPGVNRPGIAVVFPTLTGPVTICDVGANIACKPINLYQYGLMASIYSQHYLGVQNPKVGIMSIGEEEAKGNEIVKKTRDLLRADPRINFIGNVEGRDIFRGACDVIVCEGFVGNVILKVTEGLASSLLADVQSALASANADRGAGNKRVLADLTRRNDYAEYGGAPLLGVDGICIIGHGSSDARAVFNALRVAREFGGHRIIERIAEAV